MPTRRKPPKDDMPPARETSEGRAIFQQEFLEDLRYWVETDRNTALRTLDLVEAILRDPFVGIGKLEPLKYLGPNIWSRRITQVHRIVYKIEHDAVHFVQARYHYG